MKGSPQRLGDTAATIRRVRAITMGAGAVRATLGARKTQFRVPIILREFGPSTTPGYDWTFRDRRGLWNDLTTAKLMLSKHCPLHIGDRLWVKETFSLDALTVYPCPPVWYRADCSLYDDPSSGDHTRSCEAARTGSAIADCYACAMNGRRFRWRPSIFMPHGLSRITLDVTEVRVQRLQEVSEADAKAEGARELPLQEGRPGAWWTCDVHVGASVFGRTPIEAFRKLWDHLNGKRSPWERNDWVFAHTFKRLA